MSVAECVEHVRTLAGANLPVVVGGAVAVLVLTFLAIRWRRGVFAPHPALLNAGPPARALEEERAMNWAPPEQSYADRRGAVRREGSPVRVVLSSTTFRNGVSDGFVVDRSTGGLRILVQAAMAPGSTLQVRAINAPDTIGFVTVIVRSCRKHPDHFELGCEFEKTPPWNVLLLFG